jgi:malto-oligosyltrehalose trehalohydrolase
MMERRHPFGAELLSDGGVSFRFWAPQASGVDLLIEDSTVAMEKETGGFFSVTVPGARAGDRYAFSVNGHEVPDPASRWQPDNVHGRSMVVDQGALRPVGEPFPLRPFSEAVVYECHVGTFTGEGTFRALEEKLDHLSELGVNTLELMPIAQFSGQRGWGYDGVLPYAVHNAYGTPEELRHLIDACHQKGIAVMLDVVYNHFGPDGNYLHVYAKEFFDEDQHTPWGAALDFSKVPVRDFFIHNARMWLEDYGFDGLRFDAVHAIDANAGERPFLEDMAWRIQGGVGDRRVYLVLENDDNAAHLIGDGRPYTAQWNDDMHHILHRIGTGETDGYYGDYADEPNQRLVRALTEGFDYQGEPSAHRGGVSRGEPSAGRNPSAFVSFIQNHDQVGNRARGERITENTDPEAVRALAAIYLLSPQVPMLWMGEEWGASSRFPFFCDFHGELADAVREGRRREFAQFKGFQTEEAREAIPDPNDAETFLMAKLDWSEARKAGHEGWLDFYRAALTARREKLRPVYNAGYRKAEGRANGDRIDVTWHFESGEVSLAAQLGGAPSVQEPGDGTLAFATGDGNSKRAWWTAVVVRS